MLQNEHSDKPWQQCYIDHGEVLAHEVWSLGVYMLFQPVQLILDFLCHFLLLAFVLSDQHAVEQWDELGVEMVNNPATSF